MVLLSVSLLLLLLLFLTFKVHGLKLDVYTALIVYLFTSCGCRVVEFRCLGCAV